MGTSLDYTTSEMRAIRNEGPAIVARDLVLGYGRHVALQRADLEVPSASFTCLIGPNGSGKSTLLHAIAGLITPRNGDLEVLGRRPAESQRDVAYVLQAANVNDQLPVTVQEVVAMGRYARRGYFGRLKTGDKRAVKDAIDRLRIGDLRRRHLRELSGGERQRVFVAQGLAQEADLLLLDEPLTGLDIPAHERIDEVIEDEVAQGRTVVVTTHDIDEARRAHHVLLLAGRIVATGPPERALDPARLAEAYGGHFVHFDEDRVVLDDAGHGRGHSD